MNKHDKDNIKEWWDRVGFVCKIHEGECSLLLLITILTIGAITWLR